MLENNVLQHIDIAPAGRHLDTRHTWNGRGSPDYSSQRQRTARRKKEKKEKEKKEGKKLQRLKIETIFAAKTV